MTTLTVYARRIVAADLIRWLHATGLAEIRQVVIAGNEEAVVSAASDTGARVLLWSQRQAIEPTDLTRGYQLVASAEEFVAERLLAHTVHSLNLRELKVEMEAIEAMPIDPPESMLPLPICNLAFLTRLLPEFSEVRSEEPRPLSAELLGQATQPNPEDEHVYDL